jgi:hypothetical protein
MKTLTAILFALVLPVLAGTLSPAPIDVRYGDGTATGRQVTKIIYGNGAAGELCWEKSTPPSGPLRQWLQFEESASSSVYADSSTYGIAGSLVNGVNNYTSENTTTGVSGSGATTDGIDDYISAGNPMEFRGNAPFSVAFWINTTYDGRRTSSLMPAPVIPNPRRRSTMT